MLRSSEDAFVTKTFVDLMDLDERGFIRDDWFHVRGLSGVLFPEQPALPEFEDLIRLVGTDLAEVTIAHAAYRNLSADGPSMGRDPPTLSSSP